MSESARECFWLCQEGYEELLGRELSLRGREVRASGSGWAIAQELASADPILDQFCFPHLSVEAPVQVEGKSVNELAQGLAEVFLESIRGERVEQPWACFFWAPARVVGLGRRSAAVEDAFLGLVRKKIARVARLAVPGAPHGMGQTRGWFVCFSDFGRCHCGRAAWLGGQHRMADDPLAPSRSYLKLEEAYGILGREPAPAETAVDLGAAPGGWSYSAAKRGATVTAVDNGPLKGGAAAHPLIQHLREDAFKFRVAEGHSVDWLLCDLVEDPHQVLRLITSWIENGWCRRFVANLKFGRADPIELLQEVLRTDSPLVARCQRVRLCHLFHDREEFTLVGEMRT